LFDPSTDRRNCERKVRLESRDDENQSDRHEQGRGDSTKHISVDSDRKSDQRNKEAHNDKRKR
jgi:hypothetical protein